MFPDDFDASASGLFPTRAQLEAERQAEALAQHDTAAAACAAAHEAVTEATPSPPPLPDLGIARDAPADELLRAADLLRLMAAGFRNQGRRRTAANDRGPTAA